MEFKTLQELCTEIIDCPHTTPEWKTEGIPVIRNYNLQNGFIDKSKLSFVDNDTYLQRIKRGMPQVDDIIFSREAPVGSVAIMPSNFRCCLGQRLVLLKVNKSICDPHYLLYVMLSNFVKKQYKTVEKTGSIVSNFNIGDLKNLVIPYVDIAIQKKIGKMCGMLDRKIAVNNLTIENLESMAKTLYDYWFVQFDFPDANGNPYKTSGGKMEWNETLSREIPAGWEVRKVKDIEAKIVTGKTPSTAQDDFYNGNIPFVTIGDIRNHVFVTNTDIRLTKAGAESQSNKYLPPNSLCVSCIASPGEIGFTTEWSQTNQQINSIVIEDEDNRIILYFALKDYFLYNAAVKTGNTFANMSKTDFSEIALVYPTKHVLRVFAKKTQPIFRKLKKAELENRKLITFRDFLLPMLMNGQVTFRQ